MDIPEKTPRAERPASDRPVGERPVGERPAGDRPAGDRPERTDRYERSERGGRGRKGRKKVCSFCVDKPGSFIDYKDVAKLRRYISDKAKILPRRNTGTCTRHQRELTVAIKRARHLALLAYVNDN